MPPAGPASPALLPIAAEVPAGRVRRGGDAGNSAKRYKVTPCTRTSSSGRRLTAAGATCVPPEAVLNSALAAAASSVAAASTFHDSHLERVRAAGRCTGSLSTRRGTRRPPCGRVVVSAYVRGGAVFERMHAVRSSRITSSSRYAVDDTAHTGPVQIKARTRAPHQAWRATHIPWDALREENAGHGTVSWLSDSALPRRL